MATVTEMVDLICQDTGLDASTGSADRAVAVARLNEAYKRLVSETRCYHELASVTLTAGDGDLNVIDVATPTELTADVDKIGYLWVVDINGQQGAPLERRTRSAVRNARAGSQSNGTPQFYSFNFPYLYLWPVPDGGTLYIEYVPVANQLAEGSAAAYMVPASFHESALARFAVVITLEGYEGRENDAAYHRQLLVAEKMRLTEHATESGGMELPGMGKGRFDTSEPRRAR